jgi:hypothetical protein
MKKVLGAGCALVLLVVLVLAGVGAYFVSRLDARSQAVAAQQAKATLGTELRVKRCRSLLSGVTLKAIAVQNPAPFGPAADRGRLRAALSLLPLLAGRIEVERLARSRARARDGPGRLQLREARPGRREGRARCLGIRVGECHAAAGLMKSLAVENGSILMTTTRRRS